MRSFAETVAEIERIAAAVNRDLAGKSLSQRLDEAMRRGKGSYSPLMMREALIRTPAAP